MKRLTTRITVSDSRTSFINLADGSEIRPNSLCFHQTTNLHGVALPLRVWSLME